jgi:hypothetical protein
VYKKFTSRPVTLFRSGGKKVESVCGMEKMRCSMYSPILERASMREGRVRALGVKVKRVRLKRIGVVRSQYGFATRRRAHMEFVSICERRIERIASSRQIWRKVGLEVAITCAYRGVKRTRRGYRQWRRAEQAHGTRSMEIGKEYEDDNVLMLSRGLEEI